MNYLSRNFNNKAIDQTNNITKHIKRPRSVDVHQIKEILDLTMDSTDEEITGHDKKQSLVVKEMNNLTDAPITDEYDVDNSDIESQDNKMSLVERYDAKVNKDPDDEPDASTGCIMCIKVIRKDSEPSKRDHFEMHIQSIQESELYRMCKVNLKKISGNDNSRADNPTLKQAMSRSDWLNEYQQLLDDGVINGIKVNKIPKGTHIIGSMLVLTIK